MKNKVQNITNFESFLIDIEKQISLKGGNDEAVHVYTGEGMDEME